MSVSDDLVAVPLCALRLCGTPPYAEILYRDETHVLARWKTGFASQPPETRLFAAADVKICARLKAFEIGSSVQSAWFEYRHVGDMARQKIDGKIGNIRGATHDR